MLVARLRTETAFGPTGHVPSLVTPLELVEVDDED
jgi:hypothetical protein